MRRDGPIPLPPASPLASCRAPASNHRFVPSAEDLPRHSEEINAGKARPTKGFTGGGARRASAGSSIHVVHGGPEGQPFGVASPHTAWTWEGTNPGQGKGSPPVVVIFQSPFWGRVKTPIFPPSWRLI